MDRRLLSALAIGAGLVVAVPAVAMHGGAPPPPPFGAQPDDPFLPADTTGTDVTSPEDVVPPDEEVVAPRFGPDAAIPRGALRREWRMTGDVADAEDLGTRVAVEIDGIEVRRAPRRLADFVDELESGPVRVLIGPRTEVVDTEGDDVDPLDLTADDAIRVRGRLKAPVRWVDDGDGGRIPVLSAKRVVVLD